MAIFVCFATRAIHIELAEDQSSEAFMNVLKRFIARRGCPSNIYSEQRFEFRGLSTRIRRISCFIQGSEPQTT